MVCLNVLEHIEDDARALGTFFDVLEPGGRLILLVPALRALYGSLGRALDHFRRYERSELVDKLRRAGFEVEASWFFNLLGVAGWYVNSRILKRTTFPPVQLTLYDRLVLLFHLESRDPAPLAAFLEKSQERFFGGVLGLPVVPYVASFDATVVAHTLLEYVSFIALLGALFVISGGIVLRGDIRATPEVNTGFLAVGALLANFVSTTGASMLLIRPMLRTNSPERKHVVHVPIFFIFVVSNCSGLLTPLGDPPLFLGYLRGVPFFWTMRLVFEWLFVVVTLLALFYVVDRFAVAREDSPHARRMSASTSRSASSAARISSTCSASSRPCSSARRCRKAGSARARDSARCC